MKIMIDVCYTVGRCRMRDGGMDGWMKITTAVCYTVGRGGIDND